MSNLVQYSIPRAVVSQKYKEIILRKITSFMVCVGSTSTSEGAVSMESEMSVLIAIRSLKK